MCDGAYCFLGWRTSVDRRCAAKRFSEGTSPKRERRGNKSRVVVGRRLGAAGRSNCRERASPLAPVRS